MQLRLSKLRNHRLYRGISSQDILVSSFPKTGSTYTRFVLANIALGSAGLNRQVDFHNLGEIMPEIRKDDLDRFKWMNPMLPRLIKSHELVSDAAVYSSTPCKVLYIVRDPRDTMISYFNYASKRKANRFTGSFEQFIESEEFGIDSYSEHVHQWLDRAQWVFKYEDLMLNPLELFVPFINEIARSEIPLGVIQKAIAGSLPDRMRKIEQDNSRPNHEKNFDKDFVFVRNSEVNQWKSELTPEVADHIWDRASNTIKLLYTKA